MIESFERALNTSDAEERRHWLTFVIVGGGATGIELAGALAEMRKFVLPKDYPELDWNEMRILLVDGENGLLNAFSGKSSEDVIRNLKNMKVEVLLKKLVKEYDGKKLTFVDGEQVVTNNVFWVAGVKANRFGRVTSRCLRSGKQSSRGRVQPGTGDGGYIRIGGYRLDGGGELPERSPASRAAFHTAG